MAYAFLHTLGLDGAIGTLEAGKQADIIAVRTDTPAWSATCWAVGAVAPASTRATRVSARRWRT